MEHSSPLQHPTDMVQQDRGSPRTVDLSTNEAEGHGGSRGQFQFLNRVKVTMLLKLNRVHQRVPYIRKLPLAAILIIAFLIVINLITWAICALILTQHRSLLGTAALAYSLGLRHALDADHISAIDLMTRRLIASGQTPVTVGTFFSLGHSTIVIVTSIVVAATAAGISDRFGGFEKIGGIIGTSVSASFLILLGIMNAYILYKLLVQLWKVIHLQPEQELDEGFKVEGGGVLFKILKKMFKLIDRPWKMYPLGVMFGLGFDTSSEVALLGISSIQGARGTSFWLILIFPVLFTVGMCLIDTIDGALMMALYVAPMAAGEPEDKKNLLHGADSRPIIEDEETCVNSTNLPEPPQHHEAVQRNTQNLRVKSPLTFLYYSTVLTLLTVVVALVIGVIQLLSLILNVAITDEEAGQSPFWRGVGAAGDNYDIIGGAICGAFVLFGGLSVLCYRPFRAWVERVRAEHRLRAGRGSVELTDEHPFPGSSSTDRENVASSSRTQVHTVVAGYVTGKDASTTIARETMNM